MIHRLAAFLERDIRLAMSYPSTLFMPFASVAVTVGGFSLLAHIVSPHAPLDAGGRHVDYFTYVVVNLAFMSLLNAAMQSVPNALRRDQVAGTLESMLAAPTPLAVTVAGSALWPVIFASMQVGMFLLCGSLLGMRLHEVNGGLLALFLVLGTACVGLVGVIAAAAVIAFKQSPPSALLVGGAATLLAGVLFPVSLLPVPLQVVSWMLPLTHALRGLRAAASGAQAAGVTGDAWWLALATALLFPLAWLALSLSIRHAKNNGSLSGY